MEVQELDFDEVITLESGYNWESDPLENTRFDDWMNALDVRGADVQHT